ncbi:MAG: flagellar basal body P-ring formation chaperone FlgA [Pirellulales bacterium]
MTRCFVESIIIAAFLLGSSFAGEIVVRPQAVPKTSVVRLGDVAEIRGVEGDRAARLAKLPLMPAPGAGTQRFLRQREVQDMLAAHGEDMSQLRFAGAAQVTIRPLADGAVTPPPAEGSRLKVVEIDAAAPMDGKAGRQSALDTGRVTTASDDKNSIAIRFSETIRKAMIDHLAAKSGYADGWRVTFSIGDRQRASLAAAASPLTCDGGVAPWIGKQRLVISFATADGPVNMPLLAEVTLSQPVVLAVRPISRGALITAADVEVQQVDNAPAANNRRGPVHAIDDLIGMEASRAIQVGEMIFTDQLAAPLLVKRGEAITVVAQGGGIRVTTTARARQDGARGDLVQLESLDTKTRYDARVVGVKEAMVLSPSQSIDRQSPEATSAARTENAQREAGVFRKYQSSPAAASAGVERQTTAFRKLIDPNGKRHVETR